MVGASKRRMGRWDHIFFVRLHHGAYGLRRMAGLVFLLVFLPQNGENPITDDLHCMGQGVRSRGTALKIALERRGWSQKDVLMNRELNLIAIDRENIIWKQNHSSGGSSMAQSEPECLTHGGCYETPPPSLSRGSATPSKCGAANGEAVSGSPTRAHALSTRSWIHTNS